MGTSWITGVCLRETRLEWTVLRRVKESWEVHARGEEAVPPGPGGEAMVPALKTAGRQFKGRLAIALPTDRVLLRMALLPSTDAEELQGMAELQTDKYSPFPVETMALGSEVIERTETSSLVAMAAVRRDVVEDAGRRFQEAGLPPDTVDVEALGWWWCLTGAGKVPSHGSQIFMRATADCMDMVVVRDGAPLLFRSLPPRPAEVSAQAQWVDECAEETGYSQTSLETEWGGADSPTLHVFHEEERPADWAEPLQKALGIETLFTHPLSELPPVSEGVARRLAEPAQPLAMDLAPEEWRAADAARVLRRRLWRTGTVFLAVWAVGMGVFWTLLNLQRRGLERLAAEAAAVEEPSLAVRRLRAKTLELTRYADRTYSALECLRVVSEMLPAGVDLTTFVYRKDSTLSLRGEAEAPDKVYAFLQSLERTGLFPEVKSEGVSTRNTPQGPRSQFGATIRLPGEGEDES